MNCLSLAWQLTMQLRSSEFRCNANEATLSFQQAYLSIYLYMFESAILYQFSIKAAEFGCYIPNLDTLLSG